VRRLGRAMLYERPDKWEEVLALAQEESRSLDNGVRDSVKE
jgi:hypothetical protein